MAWPLEWVVQRFPRGIGTSPSVRRAIAIAALMAALFALLVYRIGLEARLVPALILTALVVPAAIIDLNHRIIPDLINLPGAVLVFFAAGLAQPDRFVELLLGGLLCFLFLFLAWKVNPAGMGLGDVKMSLMIGLGLGWYAFTALLVAFTVSLVPSLYILARHGLKARKVGFPFGPFLAVGAIVALCWGAQISPHLIGGH